MRFTGVTETSGAELPYDEQYWHTLPNVKSLNCYDYAMGNADPSQEEFSQPITRPSNDYTYSCSDVEEGVLQQHPTAHRTTFDEPCEEGKRKIALMVDPVHPSDYHFMRQDDDGFWSHKPGYKLPRRHDASGNLIVAPHHSDRAYEHFNYEDMCSYFCIDSDNNVYAR